MSQKLLLLGRMQGMYNWKNKDRRCGLFYSEGRSGGIIDDPRGTMSLGSGTYYLLHESCLIKYIKQDSLYKWRKRGLESEQD